MCNLYLTVESEKVLANSFTNLKSFYILNIDNILKEIDTRKQSYKYFVNKIILDTLVEQSSLKKIKGIIYINSNLNDNIIRSLKNKIENINTIQSIVLIDNGSTLKLKELYNNFSEVLFFQRYKKIKILTN
jgi:hypothetical protein